MSARRAQPVPVAGDSYDWFQPTPAEREEAGLDLCGHAGENLS